MAMETKTAAIKSIAAKHLDISTLKDRKSDSLDFHDLHVSSIESALRAAYEAGKANT